MQHNLFTSMRSMKMMDGCKGLQVCALNPGATAASGVSSVFQNLHDHLKGNPIRSRSTWNFQSVQQPSNNVDPDALAEALAAYGLPHADLIEPQIDMCLKPVDFVQTLSKLYLKFENCPQFEKSRVFLEQCAMFRGLTDPKMFRGSLVSARKHAVDVHSKVVLSAWLRYERKENELIGVSPMESSTRSMECPRCSLVPGYNPESANDRCSCLKTTNSIREDRGGGHCIEEDEEISTSPIYPNEEEEEEDDDDDDYDMSFCIGDDEIRCCRFKIASLSTPFRTMLYGNFLESKREKIYFSQNGFSPNAMKAAEVFSRTRKVDSFKPETILQLLSLANRFCCEEMKFACDVYLASLVYDIEDAALLIEYGLEESAYLLVAACLQVFLREVPMSMQNPNVSSLFCSSEGSERLASVGHASFLLYYFLSEASMEDDMRSNMTVMLLERLGECATEEWQKQLAAHQLGCVMLQRKEYKDAQQWFQAAVNAGHVYSLVGFARGKYKRGHTYKAYKLMNSLIHDHAPCGWMYQERSLYCNGREKMMDLNVATELDPTLTYPYKYRAVSMAEDNNVGPGISEINRIISFKVSPDCLELRAWFLIALKDFIGALRDVRALLTLDPHYMMFHGKMQGDHLVELLCNAVQQSSQADCWMQLYDRWSCVDDIGSLAVIHHMLANDPGKSLLQFRKSLLLLRLNCHKAAMRSLRTARNQARYEHERLVYEGWILYDTGFHEEAINKAEESISVQRSFEAYFLKAYVLSEMNHDTESSMYVIDLLEQALRCPSDGLRKGQALSNLASIYVDINKLDNAINCYMNALDIKHTRAHQGLARVYHLKNETQAAYDEMTKLIEKARDNASAYEKRSEYCDREMAKSDLIMATKLDPLRTYPYRYRAAVLMDDHKEAEAIAELSKAIAFRPEAQLLQLRAVFYDTVGDHLSAIRDCEAVLCLDPTHTDTIELYKKARQHLTEQQQKT
ncbi:unnamed protein product [Cuscuta epithymum]|uniref:BTB domain-containing protein n=1 Tax=Cuscuta epithymum TaxID=186058 RepID=A0AAV0G2K9_9ASTE|nr:unnamed protein product [Cuscuta epithymum]